MAEFPSAEFLGDSGTREHVARYLELQALRAASEAQIAANMAVGSDLAAQREIAKRNEELANDHEHRILHYTGDVETKMLLVVRATMNEWMRLDEQNGLGNRPYEFHLTSRGGDIIAGLAMYDYLRAVNAKHPLTTVAVGMCASMATVVVQAGQQRISYPNTSWLIHQASWGAMGKQGEIEDAQAHVKLVEDRIFEILAERSHHTTKYLRKESGRRDWWFLGAKAAELGLVDGLFE